VQVRWCGARAGCKLSSPKPLSIRWSRSSQPNSHTFHSRNLKNQTLVSHSLRAQSCTSAPALHLHCTCSLSVCRCGVSSPLPVGFCHASDRLRRQSTRLSLRCRRREGWNGSGFWWVRVPQYHYGECVSISVSLLNHHHSPRCLLISRGITAATWRQDREGRASDHCTHVALFVVLILFSEMRPSRGSLSVLHSDRKDCGVPRLVDGVGGRHRTGYHQQCCASLH
jgi:hypothetical protein